MDENISHLPRRRHRRSKAQEFKEYYLPYIILGVAAITIIVMIIGALLRG